MIWTIIKICVNGRSVNAQGLSFANLKTTDADYQLTQTNVSLSWIPAYIARSKFSEDNLHST